MIIILKLISILNLTYIELYNYFKLFLILYKKFKKKILKQNIIYLFD